MTEQIWAYIICCADDCDTLPDAIDSLSMFSDRIYLIDGGNISLVHYPRYNTPIAEWIHTRPEYNRGMWGSSRIELVWHDFVSYGPQRNFTLEYLKQSPTRPKWLVWIDSDEACSNEMINAINGGYLDRLPDGTEGVYAKWLNLVQDEQHCVGGHHSDWLAHPRIVKVDNHYWSGSVHEHMVIDRNKLERLDVRIIHTRALFRRRLLIQRSHPNIKNKPDPLWDDAQMTGIPVGVTWKPLRWPDGEIILPFDQDAREIWDREGNLIEK